MRARSWMLLLCGAVSQVVIAGKVFAQIWLVVLINDHSYPKEWSDEYMRRAAGGALFVIGVIVIILIALAINKKTNFPRCVDRYRKNDSKD